MTSTTFALAVWLAAVQEGPPTDDDGPDARSAMRRSHLPWLVRWRPERHQVELGSLGGAFFASERHDLYDPDTAPPEALWAVSPNVGLRLGYFPWRFVGVEVEGTIIPTRLRSITDDFVLAYSVFGQVVARLPWFSVTPFVLVGGGLLGVASPTLLLGDDVDPAFHYGGGLELFVHRHVALRFEARHILSAEAAVQDGSTSHVQAVAGVSATFGRAKPRPSPPTPDPDRDRDGIDDVVDRCPDRVGVAPHGCPDTDGDGRWDGDDRCPSEPADTADGCPLLDADGDGVLPPTDACPDRPETLNGFEDEDGCPDELPPRLRAFEGTLAGIEFKLDSAALEPSSSAALEAAVEVLTDYPGTRVRIIGHTDDVGTEAYNLDLSIRRAETVRDVLVAAGIDPDRIAVEGRGASEPLVPNDTEAHRRQNRRIDFEVLRPARPSP